MDEALDIVLSEDKITMEEALFLLWDHLSNLHLSQINEVKEDLAHAFS
jgi:hypothetical protein